MHVLILNWRDIKSPRGGGAERVTHDVARRLVQRGHTVVWLSSVAEGLPASETIDGVRILRRGTEATTRLFAPRLARAERPDVILEEINTLPYFAPLWSRRPVVLYMNQLARDVWWYEAAFPLALAGFLIEPLLLQVYRTTDIVTISRSTLLDLRSMGMRGRITIAPMAVEADSIGVLPMKKLDGSMVAIGRLTPSKRFDDAVRAVANLRTTHPEAALSLIGCGRERERLGTLAADLGVKDAVRFLGRVSEAEKQQVLGEADALVGCSVREGWGLTVTEAAKCGTPAVVYDIPGFRDAVVPARTGYLVSANPSALADGVRRLVFDAASYAKMQRAALDLAQHTTADHTTAAFEESLIRAVRH
jgi:glycosyltransferase involved in cell wall biosynthesis